MYRGPWRPTVSATPVIAVVILCLAGLAWAPSVDSDVRSQPASTSLWFAPDVVVETPVARAIAWMEDDRADEALPILAGATTDPVVGGYARLHLGRAQLALEQANAAADTGRALLASHPEGQLSEAAHWLLAEAAVELEDWDTAVRVLQSLTGLAHPAEPARAWLELGRAARERGDRTLAVEAFERVRYDHSLSAEAREASEGLDLILGRSRRVTPDRYDLELTRASRLFDAGRYGEAQTAWRALQPLASGDDADLVELRLAECSYHLRRYSTARGALNDYVHGSEDPARVPEARFYFLSAQRGLRQYADYVARVDRFVETYPDSPFAPRALDELGTHYILQDDDEKAATVFTRLYRLYPTSTQAARAAWKAGWWDYKTGEYARAIETFESAFDAFGSSNYRPSWLYWAARARLRTGDRAGAEAGFRRVVQYYRNSYYGREAIRELVALTGAAPDAIAPPATEPPASVEPGAVPPNHASIRALLSAGLYGDAIGELRLAQREHGTSPTLEATIAWALARQGELRLSINAMRRAYPQFMAEGGEALPEVILRTIFPIDHWALIDRYADAHGLDPYLMTALIAQESSFQADVRSAANAWGLMQIIPSTGRRVASSLGIRPFRTSRLTEPETNVRIGMKYFADLLAEFRLPEPSLASYNAGEHRVRVWLKERPGMARDEFVDDIPFPETQNYVKRVVGTTEDYRLLYEHLSAAPTEGTRR